MIWDNAEEIPVLDTGEYRKMVLTGCLAGLGKCALVWSEYAARVESKRYNCTPLIGSGTLLEDRSAYVE
jgi:hypothetical protein